MRAVTDRNDRNVEWVNLVAGVYIAASPWLLGSAETTTAVWTLATAWGTADESGMTVQGGSRGRPLLAQ
jgi:hypothetical protein